MQKFKKPRLSGIFIGLLMLALGFFLLFIVDAGYGVGFISFWSGYLFGKLDTGVR